MKILVTFALENEFAPWRKLGRFQRVGVSAQGVMHRLQIGEADLRVAITGVGEFSGTQIVSDALNDGPDICIASGLAGGLKPELAVGQVLVAQHVADLSGAHRLRCDAELVALASEAGAQAVDTFLSADHVVGRVEEKQKLANLGDAVDMESVHVLSAAKKQDIRAVAIRAISDPAESDLPLDFDSLFDDRGAVNIRKVAGQIAAHPGRIPRLLRLAQDSERAANALAHFLNSFVQLLSLGPLDGVAKQDAIAL